MAERAAWSLKLLPCCAVPAETVALLSWMPASLIMSCSLGMAASSAWRTSGWLAVKAALAWPSDTLSTTCSGPRSGGFKFMVAVWSPLADMKTIFWPSCWSHALLPTRALSLSPAAALIAGASWVAASAACVLGAIAVGAVSFGTMMAGAAASRPATAAVAPAAAALASTAGAFTPSDGCKGVPSAAVGLTAALWSPVLAATLAVLVEVVAASILMSLATSVWTLVLASAAP